MVSHETQVFKINQDVAGIVFRALISGKDYIKSKDFLKDFSELANDIFDLTSYGGITTAEAARMLAVIAKTKIEKWF